MKRMAMICAGVVALSHASVEAQTQTEYELAHQVEETRRQLIVAANLPLLEDEERAFWKLYLEFRAADKEMDDSRADLIRRLAGSIDDLEPKEGNKLVTEALRVEGKRQDIKKRYFQKFAHILPGQRLFRYYQIETKLDAMKRFDWTRQIPLAPVDQ